MFSNMNKKVLFGLLTILLTIQSYNAKPQDPRLANCRKKFLEQAKTIDFSHLPTCFDAKKLAEAKNHIKIFGKFYDTLPENCKKPFAGDVKNCLKIGFTYFEKHSEEVQASIVGSINALFEGAKGCIDLAVNQFSGLDEYIVKGCPDGKIK